MKIYTNENYYSLNFQKKILSGKKLKDKKISILSNEVQVKDHDALEFEIKSFIDSITHNKSIVVTATDGINAIKTAIEIEKKIKEIN